MPKLLTIEAYPLAWPTGWPRSRTRGRSRYEVDFGRARDHLLTELKLFGAREIVISSNVPTRRDGLPYAHHAEPADTGVAVYWIDRDRKPRVMACDQWVKTRDNIRAVGLSIEAIRSIDRAGATGILERAFQGFAALPNPDSWRGVLGYGPVDRPTADELKARYREIARSAHADAGGSDEQMTRVNLAFGAAKRELEVAGG